MKDREEFTTELNALLAKHKLKIIPGQAETEGFLELEKLKKDEKPQQFAIKHSAFWGGFFFLDDGSR